MDVRTISCEKHSAEIGKILCKIIQSNHDVNVAVKIHKADCAPVNLVVNGKVMGKGINLKNDTTKIKFVGIITEAYWEQYHKSSLPLEEQGVRHIHSPYYYVYWE